MAPITFCTVVAVMMRFAVTSGTNVLDGGTGSIPLTGGSGNDTFYIDGRGATTDIWSTIKGFHAGDDATVYGISPSDFALNWSDNGGAVGNTGLTCMLPPPASRPYR